MPSTAKGTEYRGLIHHVDWLATFMALAGKSLSERSSYDSVDQWDAIVGVEDSSPRNHIWFGLGKDFFMLRVGDYKVIYEGERNISTYFQTDESYIAQRCHSENNYTSFVFNISGDPSETDNLVDSIHMEPWKKLAHMTYTTEDWIYLHQIKRGAGMDDDSIAAVFDEESSEVKASEAFRDNDDYITHWGCKTLM